MRHQIPAVVCLALVAMSIVGGYLMAGERPVAATPCPADPSHLAEKLATSQSTTAYYRGVADTQRAMAYAALCFATTSNPRKCP